MRRSPADFIIEATSGWGEFDFYADLTRQNLS